MVPLRRDSTRWRASLEARVVGIRRDADRLADGDGEAAERQIEHGAVPAAQPDIAAGGHRDRIDRAARSARQLHDAAPGDPGDFRNVGRQRDVIAAPQRFQHLLETGDAAFFEKIAAAGAGAADRLDAEPARRHRVDLAVAVARDQHLDQMLLALEERHHEVLAVPHCDDGRQFRAHAGVEIHRIDAEFAGLPHQPQIFRGRHPDGTAAPTDNRPNA